jgi:ribulose bisphosphate carboxylase small subunit
VRPHRGKRHEYPDTVKICLWKTVWTCPGRHIPSLESALKDDESLIDEAIAATYDRMISIDPVRAEQVMSLIIRRHADAKDALKDLLSQDR